MTSRFKLGVDLGKKFHNGPQLVFHNSQKKLLADPRRPAALILGFGNAQPAHIEKYAQLHDNIGLAAISYTGTDFWDNVPHPSEGLPFAPLFLHLQHRERPLIPHVTSMNGFRQLLRLYRFLDYQGETTERLRGVIFDSCPCMLTPEILAYGRAICEGTDPPPPLYLLQAYWTCAKYSLLRQTSQDTLNDQQMYHFVSRWIRLPRNQLYLYSEEDQVVNYRHVEDFAERQRRKGNCVQVEKFERSLHVQHIRLNPERYAKAVKELIRRSL